MKFNFPMAASVTVLAWGLLEFKDAYQDAGELENMLDSIKWPLDYLIKCHTAKFELYGQVRGFCLSFSFGNIYFLYRIIYDYILEIRHFYLTYD